MKVLGINGSPKGARSQTLKLVSSALEGARKAGAEIELLDVCKLNIRYCIGCGSCYERGVCVHEDDLPVVLSKLGESDGLVLGSPVYMESVTGQLKTLLDRLTDAAHCLSLLGKYGCSVSTTESTGIAEVLAYMNLALQRLGVTTTGGVGAVTGSDPAAIYQADRQAFEMGRDLVSAIRAKRRYPDQERVRAAYMGRMRSVIRMHRNDWFHDFQYWKSMGWLEE